MPEPIKYIVYIHQRNECNGFGNFSIGGTFTQSQILKYALEPVTFLIYGYGISS